MSGKLFDKYGAILDEDIEVLEALLLELVKVPSDLPVGVLEIGMHDCNTGWGIKTFLEAHGRQIDYYGIDLDKGDTRPRRRWTPGYHEIIGDSAEVFEQVPDTLHLVWCDGCHCRNHVMLDTLHYAPKVVWGGFFCYHDVNPQYQGTDHQYHGPNTPAFGVDVVRAIEQVRFPWPPWYLWRERYPLDNGTCGTRAYRNGGEVIQP